MTCVSCRGVNFEFSYNYDEFFVVCNCGIHPIICMHGRRYTLGSTHAKSFYKSQSTLDEFVKSFNRMNSIGLKHQPYYITMVNAHLD